MWLFFPQGFVSVVAHRDNDGLLVRARNAAHLKALFPEQEQTVLPNADYRYRVFVSREALAAVVAEHISEMNYDNYKAAIDDDNYHDVCMDVWRTMWSDGRRAGGE